MIYKAKSIIVDEIEKTYGSGKVQDITFSKLLDIDQKNTKCWRVIILKLKITMENLTMKLISQTKDSSQIKLYMNGSYIGHINQDLQINENIKLMTNLIKSII